MKTIVVYNSSTGFTKQYAQWISEKLGCETVSLKKTNADKLSSYDVVIFGGWIMGNMITGLNKIKNMNLKKVLIFATGSSEPGEEITKEIIKLNQIEADKFFYFPAGFRFDELNIFIRFMLKRLKKSAAKKANPTAQERYMAEKLGTNFDISDKSYINPLVKMVM